MNKKQLMAAWAQFTVGNDFKLNPDKARVAMLAAGVLNNEKRHGMKYCPCRLRTMDPAKDMLLVCPCNFKAQKTWKVRGECWCSLFVKRK
jgi:ferredoxin-thioredoxin reductase catalytic subunit